MRSTGLGDACVVGAVLIVEAAFFRVLVPGDDSAPLLDRLVPTLAAAALVLVALLTLRRAPAVAWATVTLSTLLTAPDVVGSVRTLVAGSVWRELVAVAGLTLVAGTAVAASYALRGYRTPARLGRAWSLAVGAGFVATALAALWAVADAGTVDATGPQPALRLAARIGLATIAAGFLVGLAMDLWRPAQRAYAATVRDQARPPGDRLFRFLAALADELVPGRVVDRRAASEAERARLAADLHALVLPDLRRAAAAADAAGVPVEAQVDLRRALEDVEQLMHERQSVVLEQFGLVAALEWLAERTQERSPIRVDLELDGDIPDRPGTLPPAVARAAFRIALLALDNVVRHARAGTATIRLSARGGVLRLTVLDDGGTASAAGRSHGRGIPDMRAEAAATDGTIVITFDGGARVEAAWSVQPSARNPAVDRAAVADRFDAPAP